MRFDRNGVELNDVQTVEEARVVILLRPVKRGLWRISEFSFRAGDVSYW